MRPIEVNKVWPKCLIVVAILVCSVAMVSAQDPLITVRTESKWHANTVDNASMNKRIADAAEQYKEYAPIPRIAFYDIGFPKDKAEFEELNGHGLLLVSAMSQDESELSIKKVYIIVNGKEIELKTLKQLLVKETDPESRIVKTFGSYRADALYLFPVYLRFEIAELLIDFAANRKGMKIANFEGNDPNLLKFLPRTKPDSKKSIDEPMKRFMKREYPGYFDN